MGRSTRRADEPETTASQERSMSRRMVMLGKNGVARL